LLFGPTQSKNPDLKYQMLLLRTVVQLFTVDVMTSWQCLGNHKWTMLLVSHTFNSVVQTAGARTL